MILDSIFRIANKPKKAIHKYRKLFRKYPPKKSGDCPPLSYAMMFDSHHVFVEKKSTKYGFSAINSTMDSVEVNRNRKKIGLPSLKHSNKITKDFFKKK